MKRNQKRRPRKQRRKNYLPTWFAPVLIVLGVGLLTTGIISYFVASQTETFVETTTTPAVEVISVAETTPPVEASPVVETSPPVETNAVVETTPVVETLASLTSTPLLGPTVHSTSSPPMATQTLSPAPLLTPTTGDLTDSAAGLIFGGEKAYEHVLGQVAIGPRPAGSEAGWATGDFIISELAKLGWSAEAQEFVFKGVKGRNIISKKGAGPIIIIGAHYDTRPAADQDPNVELRNTWIEGGNDGASGVAVLLELARVLEPEKLKNEVWLIFFDAEDRGRLDGWPFSVGAQHAAESLTVTPQAVVVVDMIGDADQQLYYEHNSIAELSKEIWAVAAELGYEDAFIPEFRHTIIDDHLPFLERSIPAIDIIDFDYPAWHTVADTADKVSPQSLERVGRTLEVWLEEKQ